MRMAALYRHVVAGRHAVMRALLRGQVSAARRAADVGDHARATRLRRRLARWHPDRAAMLVQYGHALKQEGRVPLAAEMYAAAAALRPDEVEVRLHLADACRRLDRTEEAGRRYAEVLALDPRQGEAARALAELGLRRLLPAVSLDAAIVADRVAEIEQLEGRLAALRAGLAWASHPLAAYDAFRRRHPVPPPARRVPAAEAVVAILSGRDCPAALKASLRGVADQVHQVARVVLVSAAGGQVDHPAASPGAYRFSLEACQASRLAERLRDAPLIVLIEAGTILDPVACAWFAAVLDTAPGVLCYADHDRAVTTEAGDVAYSDPVLFPQHDRVWLAATARPPITLACTGAALQRQAATLAAGPDTLRSLILAADGAVHVPRRLASRYVLPATAAAAPSVAGAAAAPAPGQASPPALTAAAPLPITVIIPTHDQPALLDGMIRSLRQHAAHPDLLELIVVDHRATAATREVLAVLADDGLTVLPFDEPFNWSRANNLAAAWRPAPLLVFANDDMVMTTPGWDAVVRDRLGDRSIGALGARLLFPDGSYQHAGIALGVGGAASIMHEGIGHDATDPGPAGRWSRARQVPAVTGAFLACRGEVFTAVGGFDETLAVAFNDVDFCLRVRRAGSAVVYEPALTLTHHESRSRGHNVASAQVAWDEEERHLFLRRWAGRLVDPGMNPQWALGGQPLDGLREPPADVVAAWIDRGRAGRPWLA